MNIKERKDFQQELLGIVFNILVENEDSTIETMETRAVEIIKKLKEHINDDIEYGGQKKPILDWVIVCDSQNNVRLNNKSLLKFEKAIKDIGGRAPLNEMESRPAELPHQSLAELYVNLSIYTAPVIQPFDPNPSVQ
ncbi:hypothetical protein [Wolbachia endosymbiont (group B) of Sphaerophoria taeniata]|uniref:hypothetical protein n=1 Tax=Wolbachia endosymbiont (group B) of Sphaerophoria taeniata TaxID=2954058 RepID=UPI0022207324|nr:hypothetical protein [Wolbachia endosymbiont (group B) of Sphaerophoria taeniata]